MHRAQACTLFSIAADSTGHQVLLIYRRTHTASQQALPETFLLKVSLVFRSVRNLVLDTAATFVSQRPF